MFTLLYVPVSRKYLPVTGGLTATSCHPVQLPLVRSTTVAQVEPSTELSIWYWLVRLSRFHSNTLNPVTSHTLVNVNVIRPGAFGSLVQNVYPYPVYPSYTVLFPSISTLQFAPLFPVIVLPRDAKAKFSETTMLTGVEVAQAPRLSHALAVSVYEPAGTLTKGYV